MPIAFVGAADLGNMSAPGNFTISYTCGAGADRLLLVAFIGDVQGGADDITGVTYAGVSMSLVVKRTATPGGDRIIYLYSLLSPASGANNVVVSISGSHYLGVLAADYSGVKQTGQPDATKTGTRSANPSMTDALTTVADNSWTFLIIDSYSGYTPVAGSGSTRRTYAAAWGNCALFDSGGPVTPAGSYSMGAAYPFNTQIAWGWLMASFAPALPPGASVFRPSTLSGLGSGGPFFHNPLN